MSEPLRIMGIDPGLRNLGVSKLLLDPPVGYDLVGLEFIETKKEDKKRGLRQKADDTRRLGAIVDRFDEIVRDWKPHVFSFEERPTVRNASASAKVALAYGACLAIARLQKALVLEYGPMDLKVLVCDNKKASKQDVDDALSARFSVLANYEIAASKREHLADAVAAALKAAQDPAVLVLADAVRRVTS